MRKGFTLIEIMISITILSIMILFLYQSYASLNESNSKYKTKIEDIKKMETKKRVLFLDLSLALFASQNIMNNTKDEDTLFLQSSNSIHRRINPYVTYIVKEKKLYRLESLQPLAISIARDAQFDVDDLGKVKSFRVYKSTTEATTFLINIEFENSEEVLMKVKGLNEE